MNEYLLSVGLAPGNAWCAAFIYWCFAQAVRGSGVENPCIRTGRVLRHWELASERGIPCVTRARAASDPRLVRSGMIFILQSSAATGHTGIVERVDGGVLVTIEGNTTLVSGSREGIGVFRRVGRKIVDINRGFIDYGAF